MDEIKVKEREETRLLRETKKLLCIIDNEKQLNIIRAYVNNKIHKQGCRAYPLVSNEVEKMYDIDFGGTACTVLGYIEELENKIKENNG